MENNAGRMWPEISIFLIIVSHYSLHSPHWKRGLSNHVNALLDKDKMDEHRIPTEKKRRHQCDQSHNLGPFRQAENDTDTEWPEETDCNVTELRPDTEHPGQRGMKLTYNEYETETHRTNL